MMATAIQSPATTMTIPLRKAPGPQGSLIFGSLLDMYRRGMLDFYLDSWRQHGEMVRLRMGPIVQHLLLRPEHIRHVLLTNWKNYCKGIGFRKLKTYLGNGLFVSEGKLWQRQRRLMQPFFSQRAVTGFADLILDATEKMLHRLAAPAASGAALEIGAEMMRLTTSIIARAMFGFDLDGQAEEAGRAFNFVLAFMGARSLSMIDVPLWIPTPQNRRCNHALRTINTFVDAIIANRRANPGAAGDLLAMLLRVRDEETGQGMTDQQVREEMMTIFFAGHETTALALTWTWYLLSQHPEVEARLHDELDRTLNGRPPTVADLPQLPYTLMVLQESMRIYPPVCIFVRDAIDADEIGGYHIPARSMIVLCPYLVHRHPDFWPDPEKFDPERFTPEHCAARADYAYFPFGGGARVCIGKPLAMLETQLVLATVAQRYRLRLVPGHPVQPRMAGTLHPSHGMPMTLHPR
jgi:cytochrome P450